MNITDEQAALIEEIFAGYHLDFISAETALEDLAIALCID